MPNVGFPKNQPTARPLGRSRGFTLIEVVIATAVFVVLAAGVLGTTVMTRRSMNQALIRNTGFDAAQGFLDQIKGGVKFDTLVKAVATDAIPAIPNESGVPATPAVAAIPGGLIHVTGILIGKSSSAPKSISLRATTPNSGKYARYDLPLNSTDTTDTSALSGTVFVPSYGLKLELTKLDDAGINGAGNAVLVTLRFQYKYNPGDSDFRYGAVSYIAPRISQ